MRNSKLQNLLENAPINDEDRVNIANLFSSLPDSELLNILEDWDGYIYRFVALRDKMREEEANRFLSMLKVIDTIIEDEIRNT